MAVLVERESCSLCLPGIRINLERRRVRMNLKRVW